MSAEDERFIRIRRPQIFTGPKHQTVDEATVSYLREAVARIRRERYWGSGVTALVSDLLEDAAERVEATTRHHTVADTLAAEDRVRAEDGHIGGRL